MTESGEIIGFNLDLVAERPLVAQTRFAEDGGIGVDWRGRCWAWLNGDEAPALAEVVVNDAETARLLFPGQVRRVRAMVRAVETAAGRVAGLEVLTDLGWEPRTEPCAAARGLHEGGKVRILGGTVQQGLSGKVGTLLRYTSATVEVDGRRYGVGVRGLEPVSGENGPERVRRDGGGRRGSGLTANATGNGCPSTQRGPGGSNPPGPPVFSGPFPSSPLTACRTGGLRFRLGGEAHLVYRYVCTTPEDANAALRQPRALAQGAQRVWRSRLYHPGRGRLPSQRPRSVSNRDALFSFRGGFGKAGSHEGGNRGTKDRGGGAMAVEGREGSTRRQRRTPFPEDFGERLERLLKMAELSPQELAELLGVTEPTVRRWLRGGEPKGFNYLAIMKLARGVPGGLNLMLYGDPESEGDRLGGDR